MSDVDIRLLEIAAEAAVQRSLYSTIVPIIRHGVLIEANAYGPRIHEVQMDGDSSSIAVHDITTGAIFETGTRITILFAPPHQAMAIGQVLPVGPVRQLILTTSTASMGVTTNTDMAIESVPMVAGETYGFHLHTGVEISSVSVDARWLINLRLDGNVIERFWDLNHRVTGVFHVTIDSTVYLIADTTDVYDIDVQAQLSGAGSSVEFEANSVAKRSLTVTHVGVPPL